MKNMYIHLLATCCLVATITHAAENQGRSFGFIARRPVTTIRKSYCTAATPVVTKIDNTKPEIFPFTQTDLFDVGKKSTTPLKKNTISHPAPAKVLTPSLDIRDVDFAPFFIPDNDFAPLFMPDELSTAAQLEKAVVTHSYIPTTHITPLLMLTDLVSAPVALKIATQPTLPTELPVATAACAPTDGYDSDGSKFDEKKHISPTKLSRYIISGGYGYSVPAAVALAIGKTEIPKSGKKARFQDKKRELNAALGILSSATAEEIDILLPFAAQQKEGVVDRAHLSAARYATQNLELATLASMDPAIQAARAQAAKVKAAEDKLAAEKKALETAQMKVLSYVPEAKKSTARTNIVSRLMGTQLPETEFASSDLPSHESIAADIKARTELLKKPVLAGGAASSAAPTPIQHAKLA